MNKCVITETIFDLRTQVTIPKGTTGTILSGFHDPVCVVLVGKRQLRIRRDILQSAAFERIERKPKLSPSRKITKEEEERIWSFYFYQNFSIAQVSTEMNLRKTTVRRVIEERLA